MAKNKIPQKKKAAAPIQSWAFIDTNVYLDFYRSNNEARLSLLNKIQQVSDRIISTYQVQMEFLKNRQEILIETINTLNITTPPTPAVISDGHILASSDKIKEHLDKRKKSLLARVENMLKQPNTHDKVYQALHSVFSSPHEHVLKRDMPIRKSIKRRAWKRFILGYPPRKKTDTSIGDAFNWEWIIECAQKLTGRIYILSKDGDYGCTFNKNFHLNDQLKSEFRERVGGKSIVYTRRVSDVLSALQIAVTPKEIEAETEMLEASSVPEKAQQQFSSASQIAELFSKLSTSTDISES